jgi:hypothetical protein
MERERRRSGTERRMGAEAGGGFKEWKPTT